MRIDTDHTRFRQIVRGRIRKELRRFMSQGELIGRQGKDLVSIPLPRIDIPHFVFSPKQRPGVGQGDGEVGSVLAPDEGEGDGEGKAGDDPGRHIMEVDVPIEELAEILGEELALPRIKPKGKDQVESEKERYTGISRTGPESLRHFKRTYRAALKRQIAAGVYNPSDPRVVPIREDKRYRTKKVVVRKETNAAIIYMMDVSGSMGEDQKKIVRSEAFWIDAWLRHQYGGIVVRYIVHDAEAREVDQETFYRTRESGGTVISSAYRLAEQMIEESYPTDSWNLYLFHFSDGDNWSQGDTDECVELLRGKLLHGINLFGYGQVESPYGTGQFLHDVEEAFREDERVVTSEIKDADGIYDSIRSFLGKGR
jgi:uncharacterized sporulation protein YeaH/YhbH (DUF444 family)